ncbi:PIN domain-like protein [Exidia glandulosa HHB12029]|uniref:PIN domain-like protein n=1 Tax=Exidia glandulosa HHB12029 TaxID=1314781 RepID=A0A166MZY9_EXIGL|nr:PIN domain-like protein [Exidia glandulosa HHB12029]
MGVAGLWDVLRPAASTKSLTQLAVADGFERNDGGHRGFRIGIDASIWFFHAQVFKGMSADVGENPELRTLFFRCAKLMGTPLLPLFVFDGPKRPSWKRGKRVSTKKDSWLVTGMQNIINAFGYEWRYAPGEAEAELAYLNRIGVIDAVLTDDVDTFLFGATMVIRNPSNTLSGNRANPVKNAEGRDDGNHVMSFKAEDLLSRDKIQLTQGGLILIGLLRGGDYHQVRHRIRFFRST